MYGRRGFLRASKKVSYRRAVKSKQHVIAFQHMQKNPLNYQKYPLKNAQAAKPPVHGSQEPHSLLSPHTPCMQRIVGFLAFTGCFGLCCYQLYDRSCLYLSEPTTVDSIITRNDSINFPSVTFCSTNAKFHEAIRHDMMARVNNSVKTLRKLWYIGFKDYGLDLNQLWRDNGLNGSAITATVKWKMSTSAQGVSVPFIGIMTSVDTSYCRCVTFTPEKALELEGQTSITMQIDQDHIYRKEAVRNRDIKLYYKFHDTYVRQSHESNGYVDVIPHHSSASLTLRIKKFSYQNKKRFRCLDEFEAFTRKLKCIDDALQHAKIPCRFPFVNARTDLNQCTTLNDVWASTERMYNVYDEPDIIHCHRKKQICRETVHSYSTPNIKSVSNPRYTTLEIVLPDNSFEMVRESFTYSFSALLSDVGGSLGFFLGLSIITLFEALINLIRQFVRILL